MFEALASTVLRAALVALLAVVFAGPVVMWRRGWVQGVLLGVWLLPPLAWAYAVAPVVAVWPWWAREGAAVAVLVVRHVPVAVAMLAVLPSPPVDARAEFLVRLSGRRAVGLSSWRGRRRNGTVAAAAVFLLVFQEFELASLLRLDAWTVRVFDAFAAGVPQWTLVTEAVWAVLVQGLVVLAAVRLMWPLAVEPDRSPAARVGPPSPAGVAAVGFVGTAGLVVAALVLVEIGAGFRAVVEQGTLQRELLASVVMAAFAVALALVVVRLPRWALVALSAPALFGALLLGLALQALALALVPGVYDTPGPLVVGWTLWLVPVAWVLSAGRGSRKDIAVAVLLQRGDRGQKRAGRRMLWDLSGRRSYVVAAILFAVLLSEVTLAAVLAPTAATPAALRLYNLMHYGQSTVLSGMVAACLCVAWLPFLGVAVTRRGSSGG